MPHSENIEVRPDNDHQQLLTSPLGARKSANQYEQFSIDPGQGLTRKRYGWFSNGARFDSTLFSEVEAGIQLATRAEAADAGRIRSAIPGQYISQTVAQPGVGMVVDDGNVVVDSEGAVSLSHGEIYTGAFYWDETNVRPETGFGYHWDSDGWRFFIRSLGEHIGPSPVPQSEFGIDQGDGEGRSGMLITPSDGNVWNFPHTWYNEGPISGAYLNPIENEVQEQVRVTIEGRPSTDTANLPTQVVARNAGTAEPLGVEVGGMQYSTYGAGLEDIERRKTDETRVLPNGYIDVQRQTTENAVDPVAETGPPLIAARREPDYQNEIVRTTDIEATARGDNVWVFVWDEYDPDTALDGTFTPAVSPDNDGHETHLETNTQCTTYTPTQDVFRGMEYFEAEQGGEVPITESDIDERLPLEATRVYTAVRQGTSGATLQPFKTRFEEGY